ncbi:lipoprotein releasing system, transmembrane protein, LolC/E family [Oleidesulfovibrio alaskensis G20]|jgi:lipoprotein-releasing system permease protein|uniref:Lipoprotein releasing system, transmembrane protein, LolC/E family n=1 Tax=Oleidesulfovibrio alaskensis (strain ATCC BAA-1058 / DSM 17464 / G20) TaxID=207559 RepID=Q312H9_OLEA2|nr:lipoprotein-releasing ABC transporter permease subunit [Oleidesulfovibrio alaskensis]ABB38167.1 lipoprotein releasing system, transmembrane protein, LolC/E family [Oleidesulfovibrio alaskensis G20]MBG0774451.1 lipoprotein-releasing ABC transporter permease subunit [Oleidesulfovibrio alaskensis]MBL3580904.1 lipoprotein-releasing ABC transporter permease subunit [Oleidesulfovibrio alaskensis]
MRFELFVALRYLFARRKQTFISVISVISVLGVALGVASLIVVLGVMNGFTVDMREKILGVNAHVITLAAGGGISGYPELVRKAETVPGVKGATPFIYSEVMLSTRYGVKGVVLRGVDPVSAPAVLGIAGRMVDGSLADLERSGAPGLVIGKELAKRLGITVGSRVNLLSPSGEKTSAGFTPRILSFKIAGIFSTGMFEYDSSLGFVSLDAARDLLGMPAGTVSGLEIVVDDIYRADTVAQAVTQALGGYPFYSRNWMEMNANLFAALKLEKAAMSIMLTLIVLVGSFSIVTTLVMLVMEKSRDIAIMMSMGATKSHIRRIFMLQGTIIGVVGTTLGFGLGLLVCWLLKRYQFIKLPPGVYSLDHLPVLLQWQDLAAIAVGAMVLCFLATIYPARQASSLEPAEALRYE